MEQKMENAYVPLVRLTLEDMLAKGLPLSEYIRRKEGEMNVVGSPYRFKITVSEIQVGEESLGTSDSESNDEMSDNPKITRSENSSEDNCDNSLSDTLKNYLPRFDYTETHFMSYISPNLSYNADGDLPAIPLTDQVPIIERPDTPPIDLTYQSDVLKKKKIRPTKKKIGFLGLGKIGQGVLKNLCHSGHSIIIWNQTPNECQDFAEKFTIQIANSPADVINAADITFSCVSDINQAKNILIGNSGIFKDLKQQNGESKCFVQLTSMDPESSQAMCYQCQMNGVRYLEAPLIGSRTDANEGTLFVLAAGDESVYRECNSCFDAISETQLFINTYVGTACTFNLISNMLIGTVYASVAEALSLVKLLGLRGETFLNILNHVVINSENIYKIANAMLTRNYVCNTPLQQTQQDISLGLLLGKDLSPSTPIFAAANEVYKYCRSKGFGDHDVSAVMEFYKRIFL